MESKVIQIEGDNGNLYCLYDDGTVVSKDMHYANGEWKIVELPVHKTSNKLDIKPQHATVKGK